MSETTLLPYNPDALSLDPKILENFKTYDDYLGYYIELDQASTAFSWLKADLLASMMEKLGENSVRKLAEDIHQPPSTIANYTRVSMAFPPEKRDIGASFSLHFQASFADSLDEKSKSFDGEKRYDWLNKAIDENMSTRKLAEAIQDDKAGIPMLSSAETKMIADAQIMSGEIHRQLDDLVKAVRRTADKNAYFKIIRLQEVINERTIS